MLEKTILSIIINYGTDSLEDALEYGLTSDCFENVLNRTIFDATIDLYSKHIDIDLVTISEALTGKISANTIVEISEASETSTQLKHYVKTLVSKSKKRLILRSLSDFKERISKATEDEIIPIVDEMQSKMDALSSTDNADQFNAHKAVLDAMDEFGTTSFKVSTGINAIDRIIRGFSSQDMVVLSGRPSTGKTALALTIANSLTARKPNSSVLFFTYEMTYVKLMKRVLCLDSEVESYRIESKRMTEEEFSRLTKSQKRLQSSKFIIVDNPRLTIESVRRYARREKRKTGDLALICIDYLQLIPPTDKHISREQQVAHISRQIKMLAKESNCPVLILCQLSRACEQEDRDPRNSDLRESGAIEQDADMILLLSPIASAVNGDPNVKLVVSKNRDGSTGVTKVFFDKRITKYKDANEYE
jgi:replicative DNA helicase